MKKQDNLKKAALRLIGIAAAAAVTIASISFSNVSAENTAKDDFELSILETSTKSDVYTVSSQDTAEGDVTVHVGVYIESEDWPSDDYIEMACARWAASDSSWMHFTNISDLTEKSTTQQTFSYSGGTYTSRFTYPYCFVKTLKIGKNQTETTRSIMVTTSSCEYDPTFGAVIYQAGENQIHFSYECYASQADREADLEAGTTSRKQVIDCYCDVQYNSEGTPYYSYTYIRQDNFAEQTKVVELPCYDPSLEVDAPVPGKCDYFMMMYYGTAATEFFGESSDEFPLVTFDIVLEQGIPDGIYSVDLDPEDSTLTGSTSRIVNAASLNSITIIVDENAPPATTEATTTTTTETETETTTTPIATATTQTTVTTATQTTVTTATQTTTTTATTTSDPPASTASTTQTTTITTTTETTTVKSYPLLLDTKKTLYVGNSDVIKVYNAEDSQIAWVSSDTSILSVDGSAKTSAVITGESPGKVTLYAIVDGKALICEVTVLLDGGSTMCGDVNRDETVAMNDLILLLRGQIGTVELNYYQKKNADCDGDGQNTSFDALVLRQFLIQFIESLPSDPAET